MIEVHAPDTIGILYRLTQAAADLDLDIRTAKVQTLGHRVVDSFYVRTAAGEKITDPAHLKEIERAILSTGRRDGRAIIGACASPLWVGAHPALGRRARRRPARRATGLGRGLRRRPLHGRRRRALPGGHPQPRGDGRAVGPRGGDRAGPARHPGLRHHLPAPGGAGQVGGHDRPRQCGRLLLGVGAGLAGERARAVRHPAGPAGRTGRALRARHCRSSGACWTSRRTTVAGEHYTVTRRHRLAQAGPGAAADPRRGARATACWASSPSTRTSGTCGRTPRSWPNGARCSTGTARRIGRDPAEIATSTQALTFVLDDDDKAEELERSMAGTRPCVAGTPGPHRRAGGGLAGRRRRRADRPRLHPRRRQPAGRCPGRDHRTASPRTSGDRPARPEARAPDRDRPRSAGARPCRPSPRPASASATTSTSGSASRRCWRSPPTSGWRRAAPSTPTPRSSSG